MATGSPDCPRCGGKDAGCPACHPASFIEFGPPPPVPRPAEVASPALPERPRGRVQAVVEEEPKRWKRALGHPWTAMGIGLAAFPLSKALFLPNYVFNFLTTLVHEIGHCACAWFMGMPSIPGVSILGGGITVWQEQKLPICLAWMAAIGWLGWRGRENKTSVVAAAAAGALYALLAFTSAREFLPVAGGVLFEIGGAAACFFVALGTPLKRPFERPLYALWGWWMLLNRGTETVLMLKDRSYWNASTVYESGLAAGLTNDLEVIREKLGTAPEPMLKFVLVLCVLCLPAAIGVRWAVRQWSRHREG
jgi:hypothetical protein